MESTSHDGPSSIVDAQEALRGAAAARDQLARDLRLPRGYHLITGAGNAALVFGVAVGNSEWRFGSLFFVTALTVAVAALGAAHGCFKRLNGAWISGFGGTRSTWPITAIVVAILIALIVVSTWLMIDGHGVASALVAVLALPLTAVGNRWWMARYRAAA
jgi:hypothetical protein